MATVVELMAKLSANSGNFVSEMDRARRATQDLGGAANTTSDLVGRKLKYAFVAANAALGAFIVNGLKTAAAFQQSEIAFTNMLGSAEKADSFLKELQAFGAKTPFEFTELVDASKRMLAYGFAAEDVLPMLTAVGDASAGLGLGGEGISRVTRALGQMRAKGKITSEEMRQLAETGLPVWGYLSESIGKTTQETMKMVEQGMIPAEFGVNALLYAMQNGTKTITGFGGLMDAQSKTIGGALSNVKDAASIAFIEGFKSSTEGAASAVASAVPMIKTAVTGLVSILVTAGKAVADFASGVWQAIGPIVVPAFKIAVAAVFVLLKALGALGRFIQKFAPVFTALATAIGVATAALVVKMAVMRAAAGVYKVLQVAMILMRGGQLATIASTNTLAASMLRLNAIIKANPIGFILSLVIALAAGMKMLWDRSETFRKIVIAIGKVGLIAVGNLIKIFGKLATGLIKIQTGPLKLLLKGLSLLGVDAADKALSAIDSATSGIEGFFNQVGDSVIAYSKELDKYAKITKTKSKEAADGFVMPKIEEPDFAGFNDAIDNGTNDAKSKISDLKKALQDFSDFLQADWVKGLTDGGEQARSTILKGLDLVQNVFEEKAKGANPKQAKAIMATYDQLNATIRSKIPDAMAVADELQSVSDQLVKAKDKLEKDLASRASGAAKMLELLAQPFGEPSELTKALSSTEASVDSIISMYDKLVDVVNQRYAGFDDVSRDKMLNYIKDQTTELVKLARDRMAAVQEYEDAQKELNKLLEEQDQFASKVQGSLKSFGTALMDMSKTDGAAIIQVAKTAAGAVITQIRKSSGGVDSMTKQLENRLSDIKDFGSNINKLLASGLNKEYIRQLLEAGPEAAGKTAKLLASASKDQIDGINSLYSAIEKESKDFGNSMGKVFYDNAVKMAQNTVNGAKDNVDKITAQMTAIKTAIETTLGPLSLLGTKLGTDLAQGMIDELEDKKAALVAKAKEIADAIAAAINAAFAAIGVPEVKFPDLGDKGRDKGGDKGTNPYGGQDRDYDKRPVIPVIPKGTPKGVIPVLDAKDYNPAGLKTAVKSYNDTVVETIKRNASIVKSAGSGALAHLKDLESMTRPSASPVPKVAPKPITTTVFKSPLTSAPGATEIASAQVVINTKKVTPTVTPSVITKSLAGALNAKKGK